MTVGRVLSMQRTVVTPVERERYFERARQLRDHYAGRQCRYWVFEDASLPGAFIEFTEAGDAAVLTAALAGAPEPILDRTRVYQEVAL